MQSIESCVHAVRNGLTQTLLRALRLLTQNVRDFAFNGREHGFGRFARLLIDLSVDGRATQLGHMQHVQFVDVTRHDA